jgi:hypothetical protein
VHLDHRCREPRVGLVAHISLNGSPAEVSVRLRAYREAGVTVLNVDPVGETLGRRVDRIRALRMLIDDPDLV